MTRIDWSSIGAKCQAEAAAVNAELKAAGLENVSWSGKHRHDGQIQVIDVEAEPHEHERIRKHFEKHGRAHRIHRKEHP